MSAQDLLLSPRLRPADPALLRELEQAAPGRVAARSLDRLAMAHDASHYLLTPSALVSPGSAAEVAALMSAATRQGVPLTFRSGGTSLSGQGVTDAVLVDTRRNFRQITVLDDGARVRVQPGATIRQVNARLARHGRKLGPDPASEIACTIGGVVANNSSGMACGTEFNTYRTLESMVLVLPGGTVLDTGAPDAGRLLYERERPLHDGLIALRDRVRSNPASVRMITAQFAMKNTMGYGLNAFLDHTEPVDILTHLVIGSEGTLGFVAEATFRTVAVPTHAATGLLVFPDLRRATDALPDLVASGLATVELLDAVSLKVAQRDPQADEMLRTFAVRDHAALLVEFQESSAEALAARESNARGMLTALPLTLPLGLTRDAAARAGLWHIRKGLYTAVAGARPSGTTALLEDIAVPVPALGDTCATLTALFSTHRYEESVIFGHARDGNIHFLLNERFDRPGALDRYTAFTDDMVDLVLEAGGTLKAEHGTGRIMAPFVRRQYGDELYGVMREIKILVDPAGVLNPGVVISDDPLIHVKHLKSTPTVEAEVDRCVECGYCEPICPSRDLTLTPRQRIVLRRERRDAEIAGDAALVEELDRDYSYAGLQTCAVDGLCETSCPVGINTGQLVRTLRADDNGKVAQKAWATAAKHWSTVARAGGAALTAADRTPSALVIGASRAGRAVMGTDTVPLWAPDLPRGGAPRVPSHQDGAEFVHFPACIGTMFGPVEGSDGASAAFTALCERAGVVLTTPMSIAGMCCGTPWKSKGLTDGYAEMAAVVLPALWESTRHGALPVVCDAASCTEGLREMVGHGPERYRTLSVLDAVTVVHQQVLARLTVTEPLETVVVHPTCSSTRLGTNAALLDLAAAVGREVVVPDGWGCCAFAGDRGLLHPELTAAATAAEAASVAKALAQAYVSTNRTCEIGMTRATGHDYRHVLELLEERTRSVRG